MLDNLNYKELSFLAILSLISYLSFIGVIPSLLNTLYYEHIYSIDKIYLTKSLKESESTFAILSAIKIFLSVIKSSSGGISFFIDVEVQLGQLLNVLEEMFNKTWQISLLAIFSIKLLMFVLELFRDIMPILLNTFIAFFGLSYILRYNLSKAYFVSLKISMFSLFFLLLAYVVVPFFIYFSSIISHHYLDSSRYDRISSFKQIHTSFIKDDSDSLHSDVQSAIDVLMDKKEHLNNNHHYYSDLTIAHSFNTLLEFVIIPILLILSLIYGSLSISRHIIRFH
jgi:hypothetical protein